MFTIYYVIKFECFNTIADGTTGHATSKVRDRGKGSGRGDDRAVVDRPVKPSGVP